MRGRPAARRRREAEAIKAEGWAWTEVFESFPYGSFHTHGRVHSRPLPQTHDAEADLEASDGQGAEGAYGFTPQDKARAGCAIGLAHDGKLRVEHGLVRPEDVRREAKAVRAAEIAEARSQGGEKAPSPALSDALVEELTAQRTAALRVEVMRRPDLALIGVVHAMALPVFYAHACEAGSCFEVRVSSVGAAPRVIDRWPVPPCRPSTMRTSPGVPSSPAT